MEGPRLSNLFICYIPGLDARLVRPESTPYIHGLLDSFPSVDIGTLPNTELLPTLLSGVYPHQNGVWQVSLDPEAVGSLRPHPVDRVPDLLSTTVQCVRQRLDSGYDLAAIPPRRRRRLKQYRFKYTRRVKSPDALDRFGAYPSIFGLLGPDARYRFTKSFESLEALADRYPTPGLKLEFLEMYALDLLEHWNLDRTDRMRKALAATDRFVSRLHASCRSRDVTLMILVDHGQEAVTGTIPLLSALKDSGLDPSDYTFYIELASARFWFHSDTARDVLTERLRALEHGTLLHFREMHRYHVCFEDASYGEYYLVADPGFIFFPHDFYHPIANLYLGLSDRTQRPRLFNPVHRGNHGYLPQHPSERGYLLLADERIPPTRSDMELIDFAPSVLSLIGRPAADHMRGRSVFA